MKIVDVKATNIDMGPVEKLSHDATVKSYRSFFGLVEVFTDEGITGVCPSYANPRVVEKDAEAPDCRSESTRLREDLGAAATSSTLQDSRYGQDRYCDLGPYRQDTQPAGLAPAGRSAASGAESIAPADCIPRERRSPICKKRWSSTSRWDSMLSR